MSCWTGPPMTALPSTLPAKGRPTFTSMQKWHFHTWSLASLHGSKNHAEGLPKGVWAWDYYTTRLSAIIPNRETSSLQITAVCVIRSKAIEAIKLQPTKCVPATSSFLNGWKFDESTSYHNQRTAVAHASPLTRTILWLILSPRIDCSKEYVRTHNNFYCSNKQNEALMEHANITSHVVV